MSETAHKHGPGCAHDHAHEHTSACGCGHHHEASPEEPTRCISCGAPIGEGVGHGRSMGRIGFAVVGGFLILACLIAAMQWALSKSKDKEESK